MRLLSKLGNLARVLRGGSRTNALPIRAPFVHLLGCPLKVASALEGAAELLGGLRAEVGVFELIHDFPVGRLQRVGFLQCAEITMCVPNHAHCNARLVLVAVGLGNRERALGELQRGGGIADLEVAYCYESTCLALCLFEIDAFRYAKGLFGKFMACFPVSKLTMDDRQIDVEVTLLSDALRLLGDPEGLVEAEQCFLGLAAAPENLAALIPDTANLFWVPAGISQLCALVILTFDCQAATQQAKQSGLTQCGIRVRGCSDGKFDSVDSIAAGKALVQETVSCD